ncbi:MAG: pteridine reductase [Halioglobus sp.]|nr:pteridine reductase [Halioglobus sp.]
MTRTAVVTGGAKRIGRAIAAELHARGYDIAVHYCASNEAAAEFAERLNATRANSCTLFQGDLAQASGAAALAARVSAQHPAIDLLVNNASGFEPTPIEDCTEAEFDAMLASNLKGPYFLIQGMLPALRAAQGAIVNILDVHIDRPLRDFNAYGAAKAGLASLTRSLAVELGPDVRVNGVSPGAILWPEDDASYDAATRAHTVAATPLGRLGDPTDVARAVAYLADDAPFVTGQVISIDGGRSLTG